MINPDLKKEILEAIRMDLKPLEFDSLAFQLLKEQVQHNSVYKNLLQGKGLKNSDLQGWEDFPCLPAASFKEMPVVSFALELAKTFFETSGTTEKNKKRGRHYIEDLSFYERALEMGFRALMPDLKNHYWISLIPSSETHPHSSLVHMIKVLSSKIPESKSVTYCCDKDFQWNEKALVEALSDLKKPVALFGTSFALAQSAEVFQKKKNQWKLPENSVVFDTGGYKGRYKELSKMELMALLCEVYGLEEKQIWNEYGMTELSSQGYGLLREEEHQFPPWIKVRVQNPRTGKCCDVEEIGVLHFYDLANVNSVMAVATMDCGYYTTEKRDRIRILGRVGGAELRGCSLPYE